MSDELTFVAFQDSDAQKVADLLNRTRSNIAQHKKVTGDEYLYVHNNRGIYFSVLAKKHGEVIGMVSAYPTSGQYVALPRQVYVGSLLIDLRYRLSYAVLVGLYDGIIEQSIKYGFDEILSMLYYTNKTSLYLLLKYGFVLLEGKANIYGALVLHNHLPAILRFIGASSIESCTSKFFNNLPVVDKKNAYVSKQLIAGKFIECDYLNNRKKIVLLIDTINNKIDGIDFVDSLKIYPDFNSSNRYYFENKRKGEIINLDIEMLRGLGDVESAQKESITIASGETHWMELPENAEAFRVLFLDEYLTFFPRKLSPSSVDLNSTVNFDSFSLQVEHSSGFVSLINNNGKTLIKIMWPCVSPPYLEGALVPRKKDLVIETKTDGIAIVEDCGNYRLSRSILVGVENGTGNGKGTGAGNGSEIGKLSVITTLLCKGEQMEIAPISHIWAASKLESCLLISQDDRLPIPAAQLDPGKSRFIDYAFWNPDISAAASFPVEKINLRFDRDSDSNYNSDSDVLDIIIDKKCKPVIHTPSLTFLLDFDFEKIQDEQIIEQMEICYNEEEL